MSKYEGVRPAGKGKYEINFRPYRKANRVYKRVSAGSMQEASNKRAELMVEYRKEIGIPDANFQNITFESMRNLFQMDLKGHSKKTINRYMNTFDTFFYKSLFFSDSDLKQKV